MLSIFRPGNEEALKRRIEIIAVVLIALSTVFSSWCVYESARWSGHQSFELSRANGLRSESVRATDIATSSAIYDSELFIAWVNAVATNQTKEAAFLRSRFRPEFQPAFDAWLASATPDNPIPPGTPFARPEYETIRNPAAVSLRDQAEVAVAAAQDYSQTSDDYVLNTVLFALVLFLEGISTRWKSVRIQVGMLGLASVIFLAGIWLMVRLPVSFAY